MGGNAVGYDAGNVYCRSQSCEAANGNDLHILQMAGLQAQLMTCGRQSLALLNPA